MTVTSLTSFKEAKEKEEKRAKGWWRRVQPRYLGAKVYTATTREYHCNRCIIPITYFEKYRLDRYVRDYYDKDGKKTMSRFWYERSHWPACYGPSEDDEREELERLERERALEEQRDKKVA